MIDPKPNTLFDIETNFLARPEHGFKYVRYRVLRPMLKAYYRIPRLFQGNLPWLSPASIRFLNHYLSPQMNGFEWGSGTSTLFFARRLKFLTSVEHHRGWHLKVSAQLKEQGVHNVDYIHVEVTYPQPELDKEGYQKAVSAAQIQAYQPYVDVIKRHADQSLDFVLVDGRSRVACGLAAMPKLKAGGILVLDNAERPRYQPLKDQLKDWPQVFTTTGLTDTIIYLKP